MNYFLVVFLGLIGVLFTYQSHASDLATKTYTAYVDKTGEISVPENYRAQWSHLGSWVVNDAKAAGYGFHDVYTQPEVVKAFLETGQFPDGAVLIKEIRKISSRTLTTGPAILGRRYRCLVCDDQGYKRPFQRQCELGGRLGWALFEAGNRKINTSQGYLQSCLPCHVPAKQTDWVYIEGYPTLRPQ